MSQISVDSFVYGTNSIAKETPVFKVGHDGSDGSCDGIGLLRGGLLRGGATKITNMKEPNQFARKTAVNLRKIDSELKRGYVLLKSIDINDSSMPLPSKYRFGGSDFTGDTTNYVDVALVVKESPVLILYMTKTGTVKTSDLSDWNHVCELPYVLYGGNKKVIKSASVYSEDGASIKMYAEKSFSCTDITNIPNETMVIVNEEGKPWTNISYGDKKGFVLSKFIKQIELDKMMQISQAERAELDKAYAILGRVLGYIK